MERHRIGAGRVAAEIVARGAELRSLRVAGEEYLWQAGPAWPRHAPVLFPIVGRLAGDVLRHDGQDYRLTQHGFARDRAFTWTERTPTNCRLRLADDAETRARYPFGFVFEVAYAVADDTLTVTFTIENPGDAPLPASMGAHPAFRWPLADGVVKNAHELVFSDPEPAPVRRLSGGLLLPDPFPTPIAGARLALSESLFGADALILDRPASRSVRYTAPGAPTLEMSWDGFHQFGVWMKPGSDFLCLEPWCGFADPVGFAGDFLTKPGLLLAPPGQRVTATHHIRITP